MVVLCYGTGCELKDKCLRWEEDINRKKDDWLASVPFKIKNGVGSCEFFVPIVDAPDGVWNKIETRLNLADANASK